MNNHQQNYFIYYNTEDKAYFFVFKQKEFIIFSGHLSKLAEKLTYFLCEFLYKNKKIIPMMKTSIAEQF